MEKDFEVLRSSLKNIEIVLYDEMYDRLKNLKVSSLRTGGKQWGKGYPPKWGMNLFAKGDSFAIQYKK